MPLNGGEPLPAGHLLYSLSWLSLIDIFWPWAGPWAVGHLASLAQGHPPDDCGLWAE